MYFYAFYPLGFDLERRCRPWLSVGLMAVMGVALVWIRYAPDAFSVRPETLVFWPGNRSPITVVTAVFLHGSWLHLLGNLIYLWVFAPILEDRLGRGRFLLMFIMLGAAGNLAHGVVALAGWLGNVPAGVLGASGAVSGLLGMSLTRLPFARIVVAYWVFAPLVGQNRAGRLKLSLPVAVLAWLLLQVVHAAAAPLTGTAVSYGAHFGGFVLGLLMGWCLGLGREGRAEGRLVTARSYLANGQAFAAMGAYEEYLQGVPEDLGVRREQVRAATMAGQTDTARRYCRALYQALRQQGLVDEALDVYLEGRRLPGGLGLPAAELAVLARHFETKRDNSAAVWAYQDLLAVQAEGEYSQRAWVRIVMLLHADSDRRTEAGQWLQRAWKRLPPGAWRDFLAEEFRLVEEKHGDPAPGPERCLGAPGA